MNDDQLFGKLVDYAPPPSPKDLSLNGAHAYLRPLTPTDAAELTANFNVDKNIWNYLSYGPFDQAEDYADWIIKQIATGEAYFHTIRLTATDQAVGVASYLRINPEAGSIEVGHINYSPALQSTIAATETMFLMMDWAFSNGYRRYEWKCNAHNKKSRAAAQRLGFSFEGIFRQAEISKGRNRDTAWFGIIDQEYPALKSAFETWLLDDNFDADGQQIKRLSDLTKPIRVANDPAL